jgi:[glutamine synthetase] adenylyltransferase / [glutamine synthetase]-adenylyl-L-tyrosine phosphorylase
MIAERLFGRGDACRAACFCYAQFVRDGPGSNPAQLLDLSQFRDPARSRRDLDALQPRLSTATFAALPSLLTDVADPDQALSFLERLGATQGDVIALLDANRVLLHYALLVFGTSYWLGEAIIQNPDLLSSLQREKNLERLFEREDFRERLARFRSRLTGAELPLLLARFKKREYVRIALRDLLGIARLAETTAEISALADVLIEAALQAAKEQMHKRYGSAQQVDERGRRTAARFAVLALGKLGGNELNYSSDVDLLYLYDGVDAPPGELSLREYFIRQAQAMTEMLSRSTPEGSVFRIDLRLRPQGQEGEPAVALRQALHYYSHSAHDWELQALIKARYSAGDPELAREFLRGIESRVYTTNINFAAIETMINSRRKIGDHRRRSLSLRKGPPTVDVKLDRGGIRDIEFLVQCLQRVYGGQEPWLRARGTLFSLTKLHDKGHLSGADFHELSAAYEFLRTVEHRLQLQRGQQLHRLPPPAAELEVLARCVHRDSNSGTNGLLRSLRERMGRVAAIYERIVHNQQQREKGGPDAATPESYFIGARELAFDQLLERLKTDSPGWFTAISEAQLARHGRRNLHRFLGSAMAAPEKYNVLLENTAAAHSAIALFESSDYLSDALARQPQMLRMLNGILEDGNARLQSSSRFSLRSSGRNLNESLAMLRRKFHLARFSIAAEDVLSARPVFVSLKINTQLADEAIRAALRIVEAERSLAVFALGRLGSEEFDTASDADLVFVRAPEADEEEARLDAERLVQALAAYTKEGPLFAVDARLRPHGSEGELVSTVGQVERYLREEAQSWEALTYTKLRFVAGNEEVRPLLLAPAWHQIIEIAHRPGFSAAVEEMRGKLEKSNRYPGSFKLAAGGFYDIDFITSYIMLREANLVSGNTEEKLQQLNEAGFLDAPVFVRLREAALLYRTTDHAIRLVTGRARPELPAIEHHRGAVENMVGNMLRRPEGNRLQAELQRTQQDVRGIFLEIVRSG